MKDFLQRNIERLEGMRKEIPRPIEVYTEKDLNFSQKRNQIIGYNSLLDQEIEYYKSELKKLIIS